MQKTLKESSYSNMYVIRIVPVCNGKIYVIPRHSSQAETSLLDVPIHEPVQTMPSPQGKAALKLKERYRMHINSSEQPRFSIKYRMSSSDKETVYLYILPLRKEEEIHFSHGKFIRAEEVWTSGKFFSSHLQEESELLGMAAELWRDFYAGNGGEGKF